MRPELANDIETFSGKDLKTGNTYNYVEHPDFTILMASYYNSDFPGQGIQTMDFTKYECPSWFVEWLLNENLLKTAYNANFEIICWEKYLGVKLDVTQWECTMARAGMLGYPMNLEGAAAAMKVEQQKDKEGKALIRYFSMPCKPTKANGFRTRNLPEHAPDKWAKYLAYNKQDVATELSIREKLRNWPMYQPEIPVWQLDQKINAAGVRVDVDFVHAAIEMDAEYKKRLTAEAKALTGLANPNSAAQLKAWLSEEADEEITSLKKDEIPALLAKHFDNTFIQRALQLRAGLSKTSVKKYAAMLAGLCADGRVRGLFQYGGANRTLRWAGRKVQVQNLPRNEMHADLLDFARRTVKARDLETLIFMFGNVSDVLSQLIRTAFIPADEHIFAPADFSAIEARVIAWLAGEQWRLDVFNTHGKIYEASASKMFKIPLESIDKGSPYRQRGKVAELSLGYQGGEDALVRMGALAMGIPESELKGIKEAWRQENQAIVQLWKDYQNAAVNAIQNKGEVFAAGKCKFFVRGDYLRIKLPSGRELSYVNPWVEVTQVVKVKCLQEIGKYKVADIAYLPVAQAAKASVTEKVEIMGEPFDRYSIHYMGMNQLSKTWGRQATYGGKLAENITQAIARDCLAVAMLRIDAAKISIVMHVHDEVIPELPLHNIENRQMQLDEIMSTPIDWAPGLPLKGDSYLTVYYKKD